jgi:Uma2 family endonuclease
MATATLLCEEEYLHTSYSPDREYLDGELLERNLGEYDHANLQGEIITWLRNRQHEWGIRALPEQRIRVAPKRYRVPDVCIISRDAPVEPVLTHPPLACIEILSRKDVFREIELKIEQYSALGVRAIWLFDPATRRAFVCSGGDFRQPEGGVLEITGTAVRIPLNELFAELDD